MTSIEFEKLVIQLLFKNADARDRIMPFLKDKLFDDFNNRHIVNHILKFTNEYSRFPKIKELSLVIKEEKIYEALTTIMEIDYSSDYDSDFLLSSVEEFFKKQLIANLITDVAMKIDDDGLVSLGDFPDAFRDAYAFSFDNKIGLDIFENMDEVYQAFHDRDKTIPTGINRLDRSLAGGFHEKSLHLFLAGTNVGKTCIKSSLACAGLRNGKNVLYITLEEGRKKISKRMTSNLFDISMKDIPLMTKTKFIEKYESLRATFNNHLIIEEFPAHSLTANRLRNFLKDLKSKKKYEPDIVFIDYLGLVAPNNQKGNNKRYEDLQRVSEEVRGISLERDFMPLVSSVQSNREGLGSSSISLSNMSESVGPAFTADAIYSVTQSEDMASSNMYMFCNLKTRFSDQKNEIFYIGVDFNKMRLYDVEDAPAQDMAGDINNVLESNQFAYKTVNSNSTKIEF